MFSQLNSYKVYSMYKTVQSKENFNSPLPPYILTYRKTEPFTVELFCRWSDCSEFSSSDPELSWPDPGYTVNTGSALISPPFPPEYFLFSSPFTQTETTSTSISSAFYNQLLTTTTTTITIHSQLDSYKVYSMYKAVQSKKNFNSSLPPYTLTDGQTA